MVESFSLSKYCYCIVTKYNHINPRTGSYVYRLYSNKVRGLCLNHTDAYIDNLVLEDGIKHEANLTKYFENVNTFHLLKEILPKTCWEIQNSSDLKQKYSIEELVYCIEKETNSSTVVPNEKLKYLLIYFTKDGNVNGVKAVQSVVEKHNLPHFKSQAEYKHYLAEAFWLNGKMPISLNLFSVAYDNKVVRPKVKVMLSNLFPSLSAKHSIATLNKVINDVEDFSSQKQDSIILAYLWREMFLSSWFSDQEQASKLLLKNKHILTYVQWMVPTMGKQMLTSHRVEDYYRLIQFSLENGFNRMTELLIRLLFDYYYIHQDIERCNAVIKYSANFNSCLTEDQHRRYVQLLLKSKDAEHFKSIIKKPQDLKFKF